MRARAKRPLTLQLPLLPRGILESGPTSCAGAWTPLLLLRLARAAPIRLWIKEEVSFFGGGLASSTVGSSSASCIIITTGVALPLVFIDTIIATTGKKTMGSPPRLLGELEVGR